MKPVSGFDPIATCSVWVMGVLLWCFKYRPVSWHTALEVHFFPSVKYWAMRWFMLELKVYASEFSWLQLKSWLLQPEDPSLYSWWCHTWPGSGSKPPWFQTPWKSHPSLLKSDGLGDTGIVLNSKASNCPYRVSLISTDVSFLPRAQIKYIELGQRDIWMIKRTLKWHLFWRFLVIHLANNKKIILNEYCKFFY